MSVAQFIIAMSEYEKPELNGVHRLFFTQYFEMHATTTVIMIKRRAASTQ